MEQNIVHITTIILTYHMHKTDMHSKSYPHHKNASDTENYQDLAEKHEVNLRVGSTGRGSVKRAVGSRVGADPPDRTR